LGGCWLRGGGERVGGVGGWGVWKVVWSAYRVESDGGGGTNGMRGCERGGGEDLSGREVEVRTDETRWGGGMEGDDGTECDRGEGGGCGVDGEEGRLGW